jgi:transposase
VPVIVDRLTGQVRPAQIFVAVMGASNFTYAEASWTQALADCDDRRQAARIERVQVRRMGSAVDD